MINILFYFVQGYVMDKCGCCQVCGRTEHELCDVSPGEGKYGICGDNLVCTRKLEVEICVEIAV